jgi:dTDP-4-dehydrorhamnose 3,5-epimerase
MIYHYTPIPGVFLIETERREDSRGWFSRTYCAEEFSDMGMETNFAQCSTSFNEMRGTLRGLHYQTVPYAETKLVRCVRGAIFDVVVDIRPESATFGQWIAAELTGEDGSMLYIPMGCAHGFQTLAPYTEIFYQISTPYQAEHSAGIRWNDPSLNIDWPLANPIISEQDSEWPILANNANGGPATGTHAVQAVADYTPDAKSASYG